ncbi:MAG: hypothetical protein M1825_005855 [Sarcosagium campestre]|nr:MAG: hypothetical protein M1825_005855 [Sarcosagium campestre]
MASGKESSSRPPLPQSTSSQTPPVTPTRAPITASAYSSPSSLRGEEDALVLELSARFLRAGFSGEATPKCILPFGPAERRRAGDYSAWLRAGPEHTAQSKRGRKSGRGRSWGEAHELWRMDLRGLDLRLFEDKVERAAREAFTNYLLIDSKPRRLLLALPPDLPHPLISSVLTTLFNYFQAPSITLLPTPVLTIVSAGLRTALVIDIGWSETVLTAIYEYREVYRSRSERAGKMLTKELAKLLSASVREATQDTRSEAKDADAFESAVSLEETEEILARLVWCRASHAPRRQNRDDKIRTPAAEPDITSLSLEQEQSQEQPPLDDTIFRVDLTSTSPPTTIKLSSSSLADIVDRTLLHDPPSTAPEASQDHLLDDHELFLPLLAYEALLALPNDIRSLCMSRIVITGGISNIPCLKQRILDEIDLLITQRRWNKIRGGPSKVQDSQPTTITTTTTSPAYPEESTTDLIAPHAASPDPDPIEDKIRREAQKSDKPHVQGVIRGVESLGAWAGASLLAHLKVRGIVEVERERFLLHGLEGTARRADMSVVPPRSSVAAAAAAAATPSTGANRTSGAGGDRSSWTLGVWA